MSRYMSHCVLVFPFGNIRTVADTSHQTVKIAPMGLIFTVLTPFAVGYLLSYLLRSINAVVAPNLVADIGLSAAELGILTSVYLLTFAAFQLPLGVLLDRYGPRRVHTFLLGVAALGTLIFSFGDNFWILLFGRALIGLGFAGGLMAAFKAIVIWAPEKRRAFANSYILAFGGVGVLVATLPTELLVQEIGWRVLFQILAGLIIAVAVLIYFIVPDSKEDGAVETLSQQVHGIVEILQNRVFWKIVPLMATTLGTHLAIQTLWAGPWFRDVAGFDRDAVAFYLMIMAIAFLIGVLFIGAVADWLQNFGIGLLQVMTGIVVLLLLSEVAIILGLLEINMIMWVVFSVTGIGAILGFAWLSSYFGQALAGRVNTAANLSVFATAFLAQYLIGEIIDLFPLSATGGYVPASYQMAFGVFLALQCLAFLWFLTGAKLYRAKREGAG